MHVSFTQVQNFITCLIILVYYTLILSKPCPQIEKKIFKEIHQFYSLTPKITSPWSGGGVMKFTIFCFFLPYRSYISNLVKIGPVVLVKKILMHDGVIKYPYQAALLGLEIYRIQRLILSFH